MKSSTACLLMAMLVLMHSATAKYVAPSQAYPGIAPKDRPMFILVTHDDNTDKVASSTVTSITRKHSNPNGCKIPAAFYTTSSLSDCNTVKSLYNIGHEIGVHTMTHRDLHKMSFNEKKKEIIGARDWIEKCGINRSEVVGARSPFLSDDADVRSILAAGGFLYDTSIPEVFPSPTSPSAEKRLLPYSLDKGMPQFYSCRWFSDINHCTRAEKHPGLFELPMWMYQKGPDTPSVSDLMDPPNPYKILKAEFDRNYAANRAPVGIWTHSSATGYLTKAANRDGISQFLKYALAKPNVWVITPKQLIAYMQNPVPASKMPDFMKATGVCSRSGIPRISWRK